MVLAWEEMTLAPAPTRKTPPAPPTRTVSIVRRFMEIPVAFRLCGAVLRFEAGIVVLLSWSALVPDEDADLAGRGEEHRGTVAHHSGAEDRRGVLRRAEFARIGLEAQIGLPEGARV